MNLNRMNKNFLFAVCIVIASVVLFMLPTGFEESIQPDSWYAKAKVLKTDNSDIHKSLIVKTGSQELTVEIISGPHRGKLGHAINMLTGKLELDEFYIPGRNILLEYALNPNGDISYAVARGNYRLGITALLMGMFCVLLLAVAGWTGFKAILSFIFSALVIWKLMIPLYLKGYDPVYVGLVLVAVMIATITFLIGGIGKKGVVTFLGSMMGLALTAVLAYVFTKGFRLHGAVRPFAETLLYSGFHDLNLTRLFQAGVVTGACGAVTDLAMDITVAMDEIIKTNPRIPIRKHMAAGMSVGKSVIGTMTTTLLFAYSGSYMAMLMLFMGRGVPPENFMNIHFISAEILNVLVGSFGLITVAPFTVLIAGLFFHFPKKTENLQTASCHSSEH